MQTRGSKSIAIYCPAVIFLLFGGTARQLNTGTMLSSSDSSWDDTQGPSQFEDLDAWDAEDDDDAMRPSRHTTSDDERQFVPPGGSSQAEDQLKQRVAILERQMDVLHEVYTLGLGTSKLRRRADVQKEQRIARKIMRRARMRTPPGAAPKDDVTRGGTKRKFIDLDADRPPTPQRLRSSATHQPIPAATNSPGAAMSCNSDPRAVVLARACEPTPDRPFHIGQTWCGAAATPMVRPPPPSTEPPHHIVQKYKVGKAEGAAPTVEQLNGKYVQIWPSAPRRVPVSLASSPLRSDSCRPTGGLTAKSMAIKPEKAKPPNRMPS